MHVKYFVYISEANSDKFSLVVLAFYCSSAVRASPLFYYGEELQHFYRFILYI